MYNVYLLTLSWVSDTLGSHGNNSCTFEKRVEAGATLETFFNSLADDNPEFAKLVYNPKTGKFNNQVFLLINDLIVRFDEVKTAPLKDKDYITLVPIIYGG
jgi:hypothetical protein